MTKKKSFITTALAYSLRDAPLQENPQLLGRVLRPKVEVRRQQQHHHHPGANPINHFFLAR
jgi:hypothetical protein